MPLVTITGPDGVARETLAFSTTFARRFIQGTLPDDAIDFQVSVNGSGYSSDPALALWGDGIFTVPNPAYEPDGLILLSGANTISVRAINPAGVATPPATATIRLVSDADVVIATAPTNVRVTQKDAVVVIEAEPSAALGFRGMNFYASTESGGGASGYTKINLNMITQGAGQQETATFGEINLDTNVAVDGNDVPLSDPQYFRVLARQEDENRDLLQADLDTRFVIPETVRHIRMSATINSVRTFTIYSFEHGRANGPTSDPPTIRVGSFSSLPAEAPLYYVVLAVYYNATANLEYESALSQEVVARPLSITTAIGSFPLATRQSIVESFVTSIYRSNPQIKVEPGSVLRDTVIDPFSSEAERLRFLMDFLYRTRTPTLLLQVDDPQGTGTSIPVSQSAYKQAIKAAFYLTTDGAVQNLIDSSFDAYASNFGVLRRAGQQAQGEVTFYTTRRPTFTIQIPLGTVVVSGSVQFVTSRAASIDFAQLASYYEPVTGRYRVNVPVRATSAGASGNVGTGQMRQVLTQIAGGLLVTNSAPMFGGSGTESNLSLIERAQNRLASVDSGTVQGYTQTAADVPGVTKANVIAAGDALMLRDLDENGVHRGGKVDVWVQGESNIATITDTFAFSYEIADDVQFEVVGDPLNLIFTAVDPTLSAINPIVEMLDVPVAGYEFKNVSTGEVFDLTGVTILSYNTIQLNAAIAQPVVDLTDVVLGSYRKQAGTQFVLPRQPVASITSVVGTVAGTLDPANYGLYHPNSPLDYGRSILSGDYLQINGGASGSAVTITGEQHVLIGQYPEFLDNLGANYFTVEVFSADGLTQYKGPNDPSGLPDFTITLGTQTTAVSITRVETGAIPSGATVLVNYLHDENFTVTYTTNLIVSLAQNAIDDTKHATADVLVKEAIPAPLDLSATVVLQKGRDPVVVDQALRTNLDNFFASLRLDNAVRQSDVISVIEQTVGVSYVVVPLTKMVRSEGSTVVWDLISTDTATESVVLSSLSTNAASVYILTNPLSAATVDGGGETTDFRGVFQNEIALDLLESTASLNALGVTVGRAYIIGGEGRSIVGYSDDATLIAQGYVTATAIQARRLDLTANHVLISLPIGVSPTAYSYATIYVVGQDGGTKDIDVGPTEYAIIGNLTLTYDEDR